MHILACYVVGQVLIIAPFLVREPAFRGWLARRARSVHEANADFEFIDWGKR